MTRGAVACGNPDAAEAGVEILQAGGNAIDAVIACAFAMGVVEPLDSGLGAGGFMTLHHAASGITTCLDLMGTAPVAARYRSEERRVGKEGARTGRRRWSPDD